MKKASHWPAFLRFVLVRMERLELSRLTALPPQDSVSTNSTTSASIDNRAVRVGQVNDRRPCLVARRRRRRGLLPGCCRSRSLCRCRSRCRAGAVSAGPVAGGGIRPGAGVGTGAGVSCCTVSTTLVGSRCCENRNARPRLVMKKSVASTAVVRDKNDAEPRAPKTVPDAPAPKPAPASAPLPRCNSTRAMIANASNT
jgi:hypothetical protein